jgi:cation transport regulator ChaB
MPYSQISDLPASVRRVLPIRAQRIFREVFNASLKKGLSHRRAFAAAWAAIKKAGYKKGSNGIWKKGQTMHYRWVEEFSIEDVLSQKPLRILPQGTFVRGGKALDLSRERLEAFATNLANGVPQFRPEFNARHHREIGVPGSLGWIHELGCLDGERPGLYALKYEFTERGQQLLQDRAYRYLSPEVYWSGWEDPQTGEKYENVLVGVALETKPFFGEELALFSVEDQASELPDGVEMIQHGASVVYVGYVERILYMLENASKMLEVLETERRNATEVTKVKLLDSYIGQLGPVKDAIKKLLSSMIDSYSEDQADEYVAVDRSPWNGSASRWKSADAYCKDCLIDLNAPGATKTKALCKLPYRHPGKTAPNVNAMRAIASGARGLSVVTKPAGVSASDFAKAKKKAARKMVRLWPSAFGKAARTQFYVSSGRNESADKGRIRDG